MPAIDLKKLLEKREFIGVATCDLKGAPNGAPKFVLKIDGHTVYLVDYTIGTTWRNITVNPRVSLSWMDQATLTGYQLNGTVKVIEKGRVYEKMCREMAEKEIRLTAQHIIETCAVREPTSASRSASPSGLSSSRSLSMRWCRSAIAVRSSGAKPARRNRASEKDFTYV